MARRTDLRFVVDGKLVAQTPLHVGGADGGDPDSDMPLAVDGQGRFYIPGTSLAGPLRQWYASMLGDDMVARETLERVWGFQGKDAKGEARGAASRVIIEDAVVEGDVSPEIRDGVGIDRISGAAATSIKYTTSVLPKGSLIRLQMTIDADSDHKPEAESFVRSLVHYLCEFGIRLGAQRTRGMGHVKVPQLEEAVGSAPAQPRFDVVVREATLCTPPGMIAHLKGQDPRLEDLNLASGGKGVRGHSIHIEVAWHPTQPLMVRSGTDGIAVDGLPLVSRNDPDTVAMVIPGSSIKGSMRSRAEQIVRTLEGRAPQTVGAQKFDEQIGVHRLIELVFGQRRHSKDAEKDVLGVGRLSVDDCYAKNAIRRDTWESVRSADTDEGLAHALEQAQGTSKLQHVYHNAIDRWTGGAAHQRLFSQLEPEGLDWSPLTLSLDLSRADEDEQEAGLMLVLLVLRDLALGLLPLGFGTNRGMGGIAVTSITVTPATDVGWLPIKLDLCVDDGKLKGMPEKEAKVLEQAWKKSVIPATGGGA